MLDNKRRLCRTTPGCNTRVFAKTQCEDHLIEGRKKEVWMKREKAQSFLDVILFQKHCCVLWMVSLKQTHWSGEQYAVSAAAPRHLFHLAFSRSLNKYTATYLFSS